MRRLSQLITVCVFSLLASTASAFGNQSCKPVVGHFEAIVVPPSQGHCPSIPNAFCTAGLVWGGIQGSYQFVMTNSTPSVLMGGVPSIYFLRGKARLF